MASLLLDTNTGLQYVRDNALEQRIIADYDLDGTTHDLLISIVTEAELRTLKNGTQIEKYVEVSEFCRTRGRVLSKNDLWIAAGAMATGARLLTTDGDRRDAFNDR